MKIKKVKISSHNKKTFICRPTVTTTSTFQMPGKKPLRTSFMVLTCGKYFLLLLVKGKPKNPKVVVKRSSLQSTATFVPFHIITE